MADSYDALETGITIECPICKVDIPMPHTDQPDENGLTVTFDRAIADEHITMHQQCTCRWQTSYGGNANTPSIHRISNLGCLVHGGA